MAAAALSFHWNSGRFPRYAGNFAKSAEIRNGGDLDARRAREQRLWFRGEWPPNLNCPIYPVTGLLKPRPNFRKGKYVNLLPQIEAALKK
jgi:hypothetical protein